MRNFSKFSRSRNVLLNVFNGNPETISKEKLVLNHHPILLKNWKNCFSDYRVRN